MASPEVILPLNMDNQIHHLVSESETQSPVATEQVGEQALVAEEDSNTAASSTGSTPAPVPPLTLPHKDALNEAKEPLAPSQKPPKITPRGVRRIKPLRQKEGFYIQPWDFNFEATSKLKLNQDDKSKQGKKHPHLEAKKKVPTPPAKTHSTSSTLSIIKSLDSADESGSTEVESSPAGASTTGYRRQHGKLHTTRVEFLLKKYLQDPSEASSNGQAENAEAGTAGLAAEHCGLSPAAPVNLRTLPSPRLQKTPRNFQKRATKSIMQVKGEQDAAVRALQHAPRQFHAKPIPLEVAAPRLEKPVITSSSASDENILFSSRRKSNTEHTYINYSPRGSISAKPVPPSTTQPLYALLVADSVLRRYSAGNQANEENSIAGDTNSNDNTPGGLQKWLSWPAGQGDQGESAVHLQTAGSPHRPQSARPRRRSQSPVASHHHLPDIVEEAPEQLKEFY